MDEKTIPYPELTHLSPITPRPSFPHSRAQRRRLHLQRLGCHQQPLGPSQPLWINPRLLRRPPLQLLHLAATILRSTRAGAARGFFSGVGLFLLKIVGPGTVLYGSYGAIHAVEVDGSYICDTGHIVGFTSGLEYKIQKFCGVKSFFLSGEGLVCHFQGRGTWLLQTRNPPTLANFLEPYRRVQSSKSSD